MIICRAWNGEIHRHQWCLDSWRYLSLCILQDDTDINTAMLLVATAAPTTAGVSSKSSKKKEKKRHNKAKKKARSKDASKRNILLHLLLMSMIRPSYESDDCWSFLDWPLWCCSCLFLWYSNHLRFHDAIHLSWPNWLKTWESALWASWPLRQWVQWWPRISRHSRPAWSLRRRERRLENKSNEWSADVAILKKRLVW